MATDGSPRREQHKERKLNAMDYWNAAFRGLSPGGWQQKPPVATDMGDVPPFAEDVEDYVPADPLAPIQQNIVPIPVVLVEDISHTQKRVERFLIAGSHNITTFPSLMVPRNPFRTQTIINNTTNVSIFLGHNESIGTGGFSLSASSVVVLGTTRAIWVVAAVAPAAATSTASVIQEYDKDTVEE